MFLFDKTKYKVYLFALQRTSKLIEMLHKSTNLRKIRYFEELSGRNLETGLKKIVVIVEIRNDSSQGQWLESKRDVTVLSSRTFWKKGNVLH